MKQGSQQTKLRSIRAGSIAFGIALLLRSDSVFDGGLAELPEADPELSPDLAGQARILPLPGFGQTGAAAIPSLRAPVPSLSKTLVAPRTARREGGQHRLVKSRSLASSSLSGSFAASQTPRSALDSAAFPSPQLSAAPIAATQSAAAVADPAIDSPTDVAGLPGTGQAEPAEIASGAAADAEQAPDLPEPQTDLPGERADTGAPEADISGPAPQLAQALPAFDPASGFDAANANSAASDAEAQPSGQIAPPSPPDKASRPTAAAAPALMQPQPIAAPATRPATPSFDAANAALAQSGPGTAPQPVRLASREPQTGAAPIARPAVSPGPVAAAGGVRPSARAPPLAQVFGVSGNPTEALSARFGSSTITGTQPSRQENAAHGGTVSLAPAVPLPLAGQSAAAPRSDAAGLAIPPQSAGFATTGGAISGASEASPASQLAPVQTRQQIAGGAPPALSDDDELILELRLPGGAVADTIVGYGTLSGVYVPLGALARTLDLAIVVSDDGMYASGWFLDEKRTLTIDLRRQQLTVQGQSRPFPSGVFVARNGDMYLLADYLGELLPLDLKADLRDQSITITTREPFPFEARLAREETRNRIGDQQRASLAEVFPRERTEWRLIDFPLIDVETRAISDSTLGDRGETDVRLSTDLAYLSAQTFFAASTRDGLTAARVELGRRDPDARLLGPMRATEFQIGDVTTQALPLGLRGTAGRGAYFTNASLTRASVFDKVDLRGELPDGYEVELYRNNVLIASTRIPVNGRYEFLQVPVDFGLNVMRLVFYGPQGQRREEVRQIAVGDGRLAKGEFEYSFGLAQKDRNLFDIYGPYFRPMRDFGAWRTTGQLSYGFSKALTGTVSAAEFETDLGRRRMFAAGLRTGIGGLSLRLDAAMQNRSSNAVQIGLGGRLFGSALTLSHAEYGGQFIDEVRAFDSDFLRRATEFNLNGTLDFSMGKAATSLPYSLRVRHLEFADGRAQSDAALRGSVRMGTLLVSKSFEYQRNSIPGLPTSSQLTGNFDLARLSGSRLDVRGGFSYRIVPDLKPLTAAIQADYAIDDDTLANASIGRSFDSKETFFGLSATRRFDHFTLGLDSHYNIPNQSYSVALRLGFSIGRLPMSHKVFFDRPGLATSGAVAIRAFQDKDGDDRFGPLDLPIAGLNFFSGTQTRTTDAAGIALIGDLPSGSRASLQLDPDTIQDISLAPRVRGFEVVPRPGRIHVKDFAIVEVSEVTGTAEFAQAEGSNPVSGLRLELVDGDAKVVAEARSESDGYFFFEQVQPGTYRVRIQPEQEARFGIGAKDAGAVEVVTGKPVASIKLIVEKR